MLCQNVKYNIMNVIFVSSRARGRQEHQVHRAGDTVNITVPSDLVLRLLPERAIIQVQIGPVPYSRPNSGRSPRPTFRPNSGRDRPICPFTDWSSVGEIPTRLDLEEEVVIAIDDRDDDNDYVPPEPSYEPGSPRLGPREPREEGPGAPNIFTHFARDRGRGRGIPVWRGNPFSTERGGARKHFLGRIRPM